PYRSQNQPHTGEQIIQPTNTHVVLSACWGGVMPHSQTRDGVSSESSMISIESAIQANPARTLMMIWNLPKPMDSMASWTVYDDEGDLGDFALGDFEPSSRIVSSLFLPNSLLLVYYRG
ncbi:hypothetical protein PFISCL1PPCAC_17447, partial [Pristionchus fissidentatus]